MIVSSEDGRRSTPDMTLRDYFAGQALTGVAGNQEALSRLTAECHLTGQSHEEAVAQAMYLMADAMLKERAK